jgi:hypothetical protein
VKDLIDVVAIAMGPMGNLAFLTDGAVWNWNGLASSSRFLPQGKDPRHRSNFASTLQQSVT